MSKKDPAIKNLTSPVIKKVRGGYPRTEAEVRAELDRLDLNRHREKLSNDADRAKAKYDHLSRYLETIPHAVKTPMDSANGTLHEIAKTNSTNAKKGHTAVHGTEEEKRERWRGHVAEYERARQEQPNKNKSAWMNKAARSRGVSQKTIQRALERFNHLSEKT